jgi:hypothetical protein
VEEEEEGGERRERRKRRTLQLRVEVVARCLRTDGTDGVESEVEVALSVGEGARRVLYVGGRDVSLKRGKEVGK